jgi:hypothetical protein
LVVPINGKEVDDMRHIQQLSREKSIVIAKAEDPAAAIFLQIWATVFSSILLGAFGLKG